MSVVEDVFSALTSDTAYMTLASGGLWFDHVPDHVDYPAGALRLISQSRDASNDCRTARVEVDNLARSPDTVDAMCEALHDVAEENVSWDWDDGPDLYEDDAGLGLYRRAVDLIIHL